MVTGQIKTGAITQDIDAGGELFLRSVQLPGFYTVADPCAHPSVQDGAVYTYVGSENIYQPRSSAARRRMRARFNRPGRAAFGKTIIRRPRSLQDRVQLPGRVQLMAGGRYDALRDHNYSLRTAPIITDQAPSWTLPTSTSGCRNSPSRSSPSIALRSTPITACMLSLGPQGPWWVDNGSQYLDPYNTRQLEVGAKYEPDQRILLAADVFHMRAPFFYPKMLAGPDSFCPAATPAICASSRRAARRITASS